MVCQKLNNKICKSNRLRRDDQIVIKIIGNYIEIKNRDKNNLTNKI